MPLQLWRQLLPRQDITDRHASARLQQTPDLREDERLVGAGDEVDNAVADDTVRAAGGEGGSGDGGFGEGDVCQGGFGKVLLGELEHVLWGGISLVKRKGGGRGEEGLTSLMSTPMDFPVGPTLPAAWKTSKPPPLPRSMTVSPCGVLAWFSCSGHGIVDNIKEKG